MEIRTVGVVGCGTMGSGIAEIASRAGFQVVFSEVDDSAVEVGLERIEHSLARAEAKGKITAQQRAEEFGRISGVTQVKGLADCQLVIEAIPEFLDLKRSLFEELDSVLAPDAIIATNTSSLSVIELAVATKRPERVLGIHFFNPAPVMQLVELVHTVTTASDVVELARGFVESLGKRPVTCRDRAGFIANLLLFPYVNEAVKLLETGFASREDIDAAMRFGAGHPMGPLALLDLVGLDSCSEILESLYKSFGEPRYAPSPMFRHLVSAGYLGRKTGRGFYTFESPDSSQVVADRRSGRVLELPEASRTIAKVGVVGTGTMGAGLVEVFARSGLEVVCRGRSDVSLTKARETIERSTARAVDKGKMDESQREQTLGRISWATEFEALHDCDLLLESVAEEIDLKLDLFRELDRVAKDDAVLATGTSSLPVVAMAAATSRPEQVVGIHFFNPANLMRLVELVRTVATSDQVLADSKAFVMAVGKHPVFCEDRAGFIVNRLLFPYLNDAVRMLEQGYALAEEIDDAMRLGCGHPMGPLALIDLVGLDVTLEILRSLHEEFRDEAFAPAPLLEYLVKAGYLGRKTKQGFFAY